MLKPATKSFKLGQRELPFSIYDVTCFTGLPATGKPILLECSEDTGKVE